MTPRQHAQRQDRFKFHRVIKYLRELEEKELNINQIMDEDEKNEGKNEKEGTSGTVGLKEIIVGNRQLSFGIAVVFGFILFVIDKVLSKRSQGNQKGEL